MPEPTINLGKDLELLTYFDSKYWDNQRNQIQDHSGYGRHPEANGGPMLSEETKHRDFKAAEFDGTDDGFLIDGGPLTGDFTVAVLIKTGSANNLDHTNFSSTSYPHLNTRAGNQLRFEHYDGTGDFRELSLSAEKDTWYLHIARHDSSTGLVQAIEMRTGEVTAHNNGLDATPEIYGHSTDSKWDGWIAFSAWYSRLLSWPELKSLNEMTSPQVSHL